MVHFKASVSTGSRDEAKVAAGLMALMRSPWLPLKPASALWTATEGIAAFETSSGCLTSNVLHLAVAVSDAVRCVEHFDV